MNKRLLLALVMIITLSLVVVFSGCPMSMEPDSDDLIGDVSPGGSDDPSDDDSSDTTSGITLTAYNPVSISDFASLGDDVTPGVRAALNTYLEDESVTDAESFVMGVVADAFGAMIETNVAGAMVASDINLYSKARTLEALLHVRLYDEGIKFIYDDPDTTDVVEEIVLSDIYIENLELLLEGKIDSLTALLLSLEPMESGVVPFDLGAEGSAGISIALESKADPRMLDETPDFTTDAESPQLEGFASLFADFAIDMAIDENVSDFAEESTPEIVPSGTISGEAAISIGTNFAFINLETGATDAIVRIPMVLEIELPEFTEVSLVAFSTAFQAYIDAISADVPDETTIGTAYAALETLLWGADSDGLEINLYFGDESASTPIELYSGLEAMNVFMKTLSAIIRMALV